MMFCRRAKTFSKRAFSSAGDNFGAGIDTHLIQQLNQSTRETRFNQRVINHLNQFAAPPAGASLRCYIRREIRFTETPLYLRQQSAFSLPFSQLHHAWR